MPTSPWPRRPLIYEINTWVWLSRLSHRYQRPITLGTVPAEEWTRLAAWGIDAVWLMGVWERSPAGRQIAQEIPGLLEEYQRTLPDFTLDDVVGSPYCVHRYVVDEHLGGPAGLAAARAALAKLGVRLILDFVPNHVARDHPWTVEHPEYFIQGTAEDLAKSPDRFFAVGQHVLALARDPYFAPWTDVAQLHAYAPGQRQAALETLYSIATQCDGVRCDMAMLLLTQVFHQTWDDRTGALPTTEYWEEVISPVRAAFPYFLFMAEAYWNLELALQQQGFDFCYDKRLLDCLARENAASVREHLMDDTDYQAYLIRFVENHDEPRVATSFAPRQARATAVAALSLPGAKLIHDGQCEGFRVKVPVQLGRGPNEPIDMLVEAFYDRLLSALRHLTIRDGEWRLCETNGWPDNPSYKRLVAWCYECGTTRTLVVVNLSDTPVHSRVRLTWDMLGSLNWRLTDALSGAVYHRTGDELQAEGLFVGLHNWGFHVLDFARVV